jgi:Holliday junction DNA helicase RuvA
MGKFALMRAEPKSPAPAADDAAQQVLEVMVNQLGHRMADAKRMITEAFKRRPSISTPEELFEEVYRGEVPGSEPDA